MPMRIMSVLLIMAASVACSKSQVDETKRFRDSALDAARIGSLERLTDDSRSIYPFFSPGDSIVYFQRLLLTDIADTFAYFQDEVVKPYGINVRSRELYTLEGNLGYPSNEELEITSLPKLKDEEAVYGLASPETGTYAFETIPDKSKERTHYIYLARRDSIQRLTFGEIPCFLDRFSSTGRYLTAVYGTGPTWLLIFDFATGQTYRIEREHSDSTSIDYMTAFSSDDRMMVFIRSEEKYSWGRDYFGDIWLLKFNFPGK